MPQPHAATQRDAAGQPDVVVQPDIAEGSNKRGVATKKQQPKKAKKAKPSPKKVVELKNDEDGEEGSSSSRWSDTEVQNLIHFLTLMDEEFSMNAKKQG